MSVSVWKATRITVKWRCIQAAGVATNLAVCATASPQVTIRRLRPRVGPEEGRMRVSLDWWAVIAAAAAIVLIKTGLVAGIPW